MAVLGKPGVRSLLRLGTREEELANRARTAGAGEEAGEGADGESLEGGFGHGVIVL